MLMLLSENHRSAVRTACLIICVALLAACAAARTPAPVSVVTETPEQRAAAFAGQFFTHFEQNQAACMAVFSKGISGTCVYPRSVTPVHFHAWSELFPKAALYEIEFDGLFAPGTQLPPGDTSEYTYRIVSEQGGSYFGDEDFGRLLAVNNIRVTNSNIELVSRAFALMTLPGFLTKEVHFEALEQVTKPASEMLYPYNYALKGSTQMGGYTILWRFVYGDRGLEVVSGPVVTGQDDRIGKALRQGERRLYDKNYEFK